MTITFLQNVLLENVSSIAFPVCGQFSSPLKGQFTQKCKFCHWLVMSFQTR